MFVMTTMHDIIGRNEYSRVPTKNQSIEVIGTLLAESTPQKTAAICAQLPQEAAVSPFTPF